MKVDYKICNACARSMPVRSSFALGCDTCGDCLLLPKAQLVLATIATCDRAHNAKYGAVAQRKVEMYARYAEHGKKCTHCHDIKPPSAYNACAPRPDGLQPGCRTCDKLRVQLLTDLGPAGTGLKTWHAVRDAMRATNDAKHANNAPAVYAEDTGAD